MALKITQKTSKFAYWKLKLLCSFTTNIVFLILLFKNLIVTCFLSARNVRHLKARGQFKNPKTNWLCDNIAIQVRCCWLAWWLTGLNTCKVTLTQWSIYIYIFRVIGSMYTSEILIRTQVYRVCRVKLYMCFNLFPACACW